MKTKSYSLQAFLPDLGIHWDGEAHEGKHAPVSTYSVLSMLFYFFPTPTPFHCEAENQNTV